MNVNCTSQNILNMLHGKTCRQQLYRNAYAYLVCGLSVQNEGYINTFAQPFAFEQENKVKGL